MLPHMWDSGWSWRECCVPTGPLSCTFPLIHLPIHRLDPWRSCCDFLISFTPVGEAAHANWHPLTVLLSSWWSCPRASDPDSWTHPSLGQYAAVCLWTSPCGHSAAGQFHPCLFSSGTCCWTHNTSSHIHLLCQLMLPGPCILRGSPHRSGHRTQSLKARI